MKLAHFLSEIENLEACLRDDLGFINGHTECWHHLAMDLDDAHGVKIDNVDQPDIDIDDDWAQSWFDAFKQYIGNIAAMREEQRVDWHESSF